MSFRVELTEPFNRVCLFATMQENHSEISAHPPVNEFEYRSISKAAVASLIFAILGGLTFLMAAHFVLLPFLAAVFGLVALGNFRRFPEDLSGLMIGKIGFVAGLILTVSGLVFHVYDYATEVPEGYLRISYGDLRPNIKTALPFSEKAKKYDGNKVFLKGYVRPGAKRTKLKNFILVGDFGDCCFGGNPKITEVVAIKIIGDETVDHNYSLRKIAGTFRLNQATKQTSEDEVPRVYYEIEADQIR